MEHAKIMLHESLNCTQSGYFAYVLILFLHFTSLIMHRPLLIVVFCLCIAIVPLL